MPGQPYLFWLLSYWGSVVFKSSVICFQVCAWSIILRLRSITCFFIALAASILALDVAGPGPTAYCIAQTIHRIS